MSPSVIAAELRALGETYESTERGEYTRVRTPFWYPDGGIIDLFVRERGGVVSVTDLGEALGWLKLQSVAGKRSPKQDRLLHDVCQTLGVDFFKGQVSRRVTESGDLQDAIRRVAQAAIRISDLWFTMRTRSLETVEDEVADYLLESKIAFDRSVKLPGRSGRFWTVDFQTRTDQSSNLVFVLSTGSRSAARRITEHVVAGWHDLSGHRSEQRFVSLFDDTADVWNDEDFRLVESVSDIGRWSRPDEFTELLKAA